MANLFLTVEDERGVERHKIGKKELNVRVLYGSKNEPIRALSLLIVSNGKGNKPSVFLDTTEGIEVKPFTLQKIY